MDEAFIEIRRLEGYLLDGCCEPDLDIPKSLENQDLIQAIIQGDLDRVLGHQVVQKIVKRNENNKDQLDAILEENVQHFFDQSDCTKRIHREFEVLCVAVGYLQRFVQNNWTGPPSKTKETDSLPDVFTSNSKHMQLMGSVEEELGCDGTVVYNLCKGLPLLYVAKCLLLKCRSHLQQLQTADWWLMRCIKIQQQILDEKSPTLKEATLEIIDSLSKKEPLLTDEKNRYGASPEDIVCTAAINLVDAAMVCKVETSFVLELIIQFHLEAGYLCYTYFEYKAAHDHFSQAKNKSGLQIQLTGALGKRTRFQSESTAQLALQVSRETTQGAPAVEQGQKIKTELPKVVPMDDETVLDEINFDEADQKFAVDLTCVEHAVILGVMEDHLRSMAHQEKLTEEEAGAYTTCVLSQMKCWSVSVAATFRRSMLERSSRRTSERSLKQLEELLSQAGREVPSAGQRLYMFHSVRISPTWLIQKELAELLLSFGVVSEALDVYERLQLWEEVISCYKRLGKMEKAETIIREQLAIKETPNLWCFLGDVTRDISHYEKAWEMSNHRHTRSQRCMGYLYFGEQKYRKSMECFEKSLRINSLQIPVWFTYGCVCLAADDPAAAVTAFKRCVAIDYDNFEAWNNMASGYVKLKEKKKAHKALKEAVRYNFENWRVWDNLLVIATDCGEFNDSIAAYNRLMDIKEKWEDAQILGCLVKAVTQNYQDASGNPAVQLRPKLLELFGRITSKVSSNGTIWQLYAELTNSNPEQTPELQQKVLQYLQKSHRCSVQDPHWEQTEDKCNDIGKQSIKLADTYIKCAAESPKQQSLQMMSSAKLMLKGVLTKIKHEHTDQISGELRETVKDITRALDTKLEQLMTRIKELKES